MTPPTPALSAGSVTRGFDPDTHCAIDAPASVEARNAAVLACQAVYREIAQAERKLELLRRVAHGSPEHADIVVLRDALRRFALLWPAQLCAARTDNQRARDDAATAATSASLNRDFAAGVLSTAGD